MPDLWVSEFRDMARIANGQMAPMASAPSTRDMKVPVGATSAQSDSFAATTRYVRVQADMACHVTVGTNPTATTDNLRLYANAAEYFAVAPGHKVAVIQA